MARTSYISMRWRWGPTCSRPARVIAIMLTHWNNHRSRQVTPFGHIILIQRKPVLVLSDTLSWFRGSQYLLFRTHYSDSVEASTCSFGHIILIQRKPVLALSPLCCVFNREATNTRLEPTIYRTQGGHAKFYTNRSADS